MVSYERKCSTHWGVVMVVYLCVYVLCIFSVTLAGSCDRIAFKGSQLSHTVGKEDMFKACWITIYYLFKCHVRAHARHKKLIKVARMSYENYIFASDYCSLEIFSIPFLRFLSFPWRQILGWKLRGSINSKFFLIKPFLVLNSLESVKS